MVRPIFVVVTVAIIQNYFTHSLAAGSLMWNRNLEDFIPIASVSTFADQERYFFSMSREMEVHNFNRKPLRLAYYEEPNIFNFYDNDTKITGVCGEIWNMLSGYLNFTLVVKKMNNGTYGTMRNGSYDGLVGMLVREEVEVIPRIGYYVSESAVMHYTTPIWNNRYRLYIRPEFKSNSTWMLRMFSRRVWCSLFFLLIFISVFGYKAQNKSIELSNDRKMEHNFHDHLFYTFATFCCQGYIPDTLYRRMKILSLTKKMFAWLVLIVLSSHLISYMTNRKFQLPFDDLGTMFNQTSYNAVVFNGSMIFDKFQKVAARSASAEVRQERIKFVDTPQRLYDKACWGKKKYAIMESEDRQRAFGRYTCKLIPVGIAYFSTWIASGVSKNFEYKRSLDIGILKFNEFGLTDGMKDRWMESIVEPSDPSPMKPVSFDQVLMLFTILCLGVTASVVIFILENAVFVYNYNRRPEIVSNGILLK